LAVLSGALPLAVLSGASGLAVLSGASALPCCAENVRLAGL
jgi:hypothetical protein